MFPHSAQGFVSQLYRDAVVESCEYVGDGCRVTAVVDMRTQGRLREFEV